MGKAKRFNTYDETVKSSRERSKGFGQERQNLSGIGSSFRSSPLPPIITTRTSSSQGVSAQNEFRDDVFRIFDDGDTSKKLAFQVSGVTTATVRTWTAQDANGTVCLLDSGLTQIFTDAIDMSTNDITKVDRFVFSPTGNTGALDSALDAGIYLSPTDSMVFNVQSVDNFQWSLNDIVKMSLNDSPVLAITSDDDIQPILELYEQFTHTLAPNNVGAITFQGNNNVGTKKELADIIGAISNVSTAQGSLEFFCLRNDTLPLELFLSLNQVDGGNGNNAVGIHKDIRMFGNDIFFLQSLNFQNVVSVPLITRDNIYSDAGGMIFNTRTSLEYDWHVNGVSQMILRDNELDLQSNNIVDVNNVNAVDLNLTGTLTTPDLAAGIISDETDTVDVFVITDTTGAIQVKRIMTFDDTINIAFNSTTGTKIGTGTTQKLAFWNVTPVVQPAHIADPTGGATVDSEARSAINSILAQMATTGMQAAS